MTTHTFKVIPGLPAPAGAVDNPLTNLRPTMQPVGPIKDIMDKLTGSYSVFERARIAQTWFDLYDGGLLAKLDQLFMYGRTLNDCLVPWVPSTIVPTNVGGTFVAGLGISLVGSEGDYIDTGINPSAGGLHFGFNSASIAALVTEAPLNGDYVISAAMTNSPVALQRTGGSATNMALKMNTQDIVTDVGSGGQTGVFLGNRPSATVSQLFRNGALIEEETANAPTAVPTANLTLGRQGSTAFATMKIGGWAIGAGLTATEAAALGSIMMSHWQRLSS